MHTYLQDAITSVLSLSSSFRQQVPINTPDNSPTTIKNELAPIPGGSPFSLCPITSSADLFDVTYLELNPQPVYIDDIFYVNIYGTFRDTWLDNAKKGNATISLMYDCGSHCDQPPDTPPITLWEPDFCRFTEVMQPLGRHLEKNETGCPPVEKGWTLLHTFGYVWPLEVNVPRLLYPAFQGWYNFTFDAKTPDDKRIYCLTTEVCLKYKEDEGKNDGYEWGIANGLDE